MAKSDKEPIVERLKKNLDVTVLVVLIALTCIVGYFYQSEQEVNVPFTRPVPYILNEVESIVMNAANADRVFAPPTTGIAEHPEFDDLIKHPLFVFSMNQEETGLADRRVVERMKSVCRSATLLFTYEQAEMGLKMADALVREEVPYGDASLQKELCDLSAALFNANDQIKVKDIMRNIVAKGVVVEGPEAPASFYKAAAAMANLGELQIALDVCEAVLKCEALKPEDVAYTDTVAMKGMIEEELAKLAAAAGQ